MTTQLKTQPKIGVIIQARMESQRLPAKMLQDICGSPMLVKVIQRLKKTNLPVIVAIPDTQINKSLQQLALDEGVRCFMGSPTDVLKRYYICATQHQLDVVVRITGDCPLIDPGVISMMVKDFLKTGCDYCYNTNDGTIRASNFYPDGMDCEVFSYNALEKAYLEATAENDREHVTQYMLHHPEIFQILRVAYPEELPKFHWSVNQKEDLAFVRLMYSRFPSGDFTIFDCIEQARRLIQ